MNAEDLARLQLAEKLREMADHSSEMEMRFSINRIYYAVYHLCRILTAERRHGRVQAALRRTDPEAAAKLGHLHKLRRWADYDSQVVAEKYGNLEAFRRVFSEEMQSAEALYESLRERMVRGDSRIS